VNAEELATTNEILRCVVGSTVHGLNLEGKDDRDETGVCIEPPEYVIGLKTFEQHVYRTQPDGARSGPGDLDLTIYSLRKYCRLAKQGNPTVLLVLYSPMIVTTSVLGDQLRTLAPSFVSKLAGNAFYGYMKAQRQRLTGERGGRHGTPRPEYVEKYGYDVKYAMHMLRLGHQGIEYLTTGHLTLPMKDPVKGYLRSVREGNVPYDDVMRDAAEIEQQLKDLCDTSLLPDQPDHDKINTFLIRAHHEHWRA
jgi:predicted nucleotidyltransferase